MLVPSIDLMGGQAVQLIGGRDKALDAGDPAPIAERFRIAGELAVIDLDAALGQGSNASLITSLLALAPCRVGGGIRDLETARQWLDRGAAKIILGTRAVPELLRELPRERLIAALDAVEGEVVVDGWRTKTGERIADRMQALRPFVSGFLVTFVEREGRLSGTNLGEVPDLIRAAGDARLTIAGGVTTAEDIGTLDRLGADAQVGMALYTGRLGLAEAIAAPLAVDHPQGPWPTIIADPRGVALDLAWSTPTTLTKSVESGEPTFELPGPAPSLVTWPGARLLRIDRASLRHALRFIVEPSAHNPLGTATVFGPRHGFDALAHTLAQRKASAPPGSYTHRLLEDPALLKAKLVEEAAELAAASTAAEVTHEAADVVFFTAVAMARAGVTFSAVEAELDRRASKTTRRPGDAKPVPSEDPDA
ncbi:MAG: phosphoribosyl-ATP diphosphatase [Deltaproteobacteria bacterium]|nr:phosphoribosyl-ATP diphosphatase [Deltaproteobacteria bacterium]